MGNSILAIRCDAATVYVALSLACAIIFLFAVLRALVNALTRILATTVARHVNPTVERLGCAAAIGVALVVFADGSVLLPALVALATVSSAALCGSARSFRWLWVSSFVVYAVALVHVFGPLLITDVGASDTTGSALVRGQHVLLSPEFRPAWSDGSAAVSSRYVFSYYDAVKMEGGDSPYAAAAPAPRVLSADVLPWHVGAAVRQTSKPTRKPANSAVAGADGGIRSSAWPTQRIVASGVGTVLGHYTGVRVAASAAAEAEERSGAWMDTMLLDEVYLVGQHSKIQHSHLRCLSPSLAAAAAAEGVPCLYLHATTRLHNVTLLLAERAAADASDPSAVVWRAVHLGRDAPLHCAEARRALLATFETTDAASGAVLDCADDVDVSRLPTSFVTHAPFPVRFGWHFPNYLRQLQHAAFIVADRVVLPLGLFLGECLSSGWHLLATLFGRFGAWFVEGLPHVQHAAQEAAVYMSGLACGSSAASPAAQGTEAVAAAAAVASAQQSVLSAYVPSSTRCGQWRRTYKASAAFKAGAHTRRSLVAVAAALADALDLFPGVWTVFRWALDVELALLRWLLQALREVFHVALRVIPLPLLLLGRLWPYAHGALRQLWAVFREACHVVVRLPLVPYAVRLFYWLCEMESRALRYEWAVLSRVMAVVLRESQGALRVLLAALAALLSRCGVFMTHYGRTSFSIHLVVVVMQSLLLVVAMRNEMNSLIEAERERATGPHSPLGFVRRIFPQRALSYLPLQSLTARVNGFVLLVRAHHQACMHYLLLHFIGAFVLIGLSVLPFTGKLYALTLRYILPWQSAQAFLVFFDESPSTLATVVLVVLRIVLSTLLQQTIGDLLYHIIKDLIIAVALMAVLTLLLWAWPQRTELARQIATATADSLRGTPAATPQRAMDGAGHAPQPAAAAAEATESGSDTAAPVDESGDAATETQDEKEKEGREEREEEEESVNKKIDLSEAT